MSYFSDKLTSQYTDTDKETDLLKKKRKPAKPTLAIESAKIKPFNIPPPVPTAEIVKGVTITPPKEDAKEGVSGMEIVGGALDVAGSLMGGGNKPKIDTSGNTDYGDASNTDLGVTSAEDVVGDVVGIGTDVATGNYVGAGVKALKSIGGIFGDSGQKKKIAQAKARFQSKQRYKSDQQTELASNADREENVVGEDNLKYIQNLKNSPSYNRFKRNSQYTT